jgi:outer membrane protein TolC
LDIIKETIRLQENAVETVKIQKQAGANNELAVKQFEAQLLNTKSLEAEYQQQILETESFLNYLLGRYPQQITREKSALNKTPEIVKAGMPADLLKNRPDIKQAEFELIATKADLRAAKAAFYPSLTITGALGFQAFNPSFLLTTPQSLAYGLLGSITTPLINRSAIKAQLKAANALQTEALYNYQKSIINGYMEVNNQLSNIKNLQKIYELKTQEVAVLDESIGTSSQLFTTGRANYLEILMTQKNALQSKIELVNTKKRQYNAYINIYRALGGGWK